MRETLSAKQVAKACGTTPRLLRLSYGLLGSRRNVISREFVPRVGCCV